MGNLTDLINASFEIKDIYNGVLTYDECRSKCMNEAVVTYNNNLVVLFLCQLIIFIGLWIFIHFRQHYPQIYADWIDSVAAFAVAMNIIAIVIVVVG